MITIKRHKLIIIALTSVLLLSIYASQAYGQLNRKASSTEDIVLSFYKTGKIIPNFDRWIRQRAPYIDTPWSLRDKLYDNELNRLQLAYQNFDTEKNDILIRTSSLLKPSFTEDLEGNKTYSLDAEFKLAPEALYFPYEFIEERIVVLPYNLENIMRSQITEQQYKYIKKNSKNFTQLSTIIRMKPVEADFTKPHKIDGIEQWVFKTKIASIEFWNNRDNLVWEYTAPWYTSPHIIDIQNLYNDRPTGSSHKAGSIKPTYNKFE